MESTMTPEEQTAAQLAALFDPEELVCFKHNVYERSSDPAQFFCINPLEQADGRITKENVASNRSFLIEFDKIKSLTAQENRFEVKFKMPYTTKTYSGSKSIHYILRMTRPLSLHDYGLTFEILCELFSSKPYAERHLDNKINDTACQNPNRLSRTAGIVRDNGKLQELLGIGKQIKHEDLMAHMRALSPMKYAAGYNRYLDKMAKVAARAAAPTDLKSDEAPLLPWVQQMIDTGTYIGSSRHAAMVRIAGALSGERYSSDRIEAALYAFQDKVGLERNDVPGILRWMRL